MVDNNTMERIRQEEDKERLLYEATLQRMHEEANVDRIRQEAAEAYTRKIFAKQISLSTLEKQAAFEQDMKTHEDIFKQYCEMRRSVFNNNSESLEYYKTIINRIDTLLREYPFLLQWEATRAHPFMHECLEQFVPNCLNKAMKYIYAYYTVHDLFADMFDQYHGTPLARLKARFPKIEYYQTSVNLREIVNSKFDISSENDGSRMICIREFYANVTNNYICHSTNYMDQKITMPYDGTYYAQDWFNQLREWSNHPEKYPFKLTELGEALKTELTGEIDDATIAKIISLLYKTSYHKITDIVCAYKYSTDLFCDTIAKTFGEYAQTINNALKKIANHAEFLAEMTTTDIGAKIVVDLTGSLTYEEMKQVKKIFTDSLFLTKIKHILLCYQPAYDDIIRTQLKNKYISDVVFEWLETIRASV